MSKQVIEALSPAKLNLFLHVTGQRANGYHELQTAFQLLDWGDRMHFEITDMLLNKYPIDEPRSLYDLKSFSL